MKIYLSALITCLFIFFSGIAANAEYVRRIKVDVYKDSSENSQIIGNLHRGQVVSIQEQVAYSEWVYIKYNGTTDIQYGWVKKRYLENLFKPSRIYLSENRLKYEQEREKLEDTCIEERLTECLNNSSNSSSRKKDCIENPSCHYNKKFFDENALLLEKYNIQLQNNYADFTVRIVN